MLIPPYLARGLIPARLVQRFNKFREKIGTGAPECEALAGWGAGRGRTRFGE
jgi:hypothetical protein